VASGSYTKASLVARTGMVTGAGSEIELCVK